MSFILAFFLFWRGGGGGRWENRRPTRGAKYLENKRYYYATRHGDEQHRNINFEKSTKLNSVTVRTRIILAHTQAQPQTWSLELFLDVRGGK